MATNQFMFSGAARKKNWGAKLTTYYQWRSLGTLDSGGKILFVSH